MLVRSAREIGLPSLSAPSSLPLAALSPSAPYVPLCSNVQRSAGPLRRGFLFVSFSVILPRFFSSSIPFNDETPPNVLERLLWILTYA